MAPGTQSGAGGHRQGPVKTGGGQLSRLTAFTALIVIAWTLTWAAGAGAATLTPEDARNAKAAFKAIDAERWHAARRYARRIKAPIATKIIQWFDYTRRETDAPFADIQAFVEDNPDWPRQKRLHRRAEEAMTEKTPPETVLAWFRRHGEPLSADGRVRLGEALLATGDKEHGRAVLRRAWVDSNFGKRQERTFYKRHRRILTAAEHRERLDRLLWEGRYWPVRRMLWKVDAASRALGEARLLLRQSLGNVDRAIARVPDEMRSHPGLVYERLRWRRRKGRDMAARDLLTRGMPADMVRPERWWVERAILIRRALRDGHYSEAYRIANEHGLTDGAAFAEAEWLAGWISLRFLGDHEIAKEHFVRLFETVKYPVSRARGAYWIARAAEDMNKPALAQQWYATAARHPTTYYGQLAAMRAEPGNALHLPADPPVNEALATAFDNDVLVKAARILSEIGETDRLDSFVMALAAPERSAAWRGMAAALARVHGRPDLGIRVAKRSVRLGDTLLEAAYPTITPPPPRRRGAGKEVEFPLILAMIRQESAFHMRAKSSVGARGLMQLLPRTARKVASDLRLPYSRRRLLGDAEYNVTLGRAYIAGLLKQFDGSYVLALAAYNAGPGRARKWIRQNGDPRDPAVDTIDWIELIPINETRDYIQRILGNLQVYRRQLATTEVALMLDRDLER